MMKTQTHINPPRWLGSILVYLYSDEKRLPILRDLEEGYAIFTNDEGAFRANIWYFSQIMKIANGKLFNKIYWGVPMLMNYLKITVRHIRRHKGYSFINVAGLSVGIACCTIVLLFIQEELGFDKYHKNRDSIYRVVAETRSENQTTVTPWTTPLPLGPALVENFPEIKNFTRYVGPSWLAIKIGEHQFIEGYVAAADPSFFHMFDFDFIHGDPETALTDPYTVVLSEKTAAKYFGNDNPTDQTINIRGTDMHVSGVVRIPHNTHLQFSMTRPLSTAIKQSGRDTESWRMAEAYGTYVLTNGRIHLDIFNQKIRGLVKEHDPKSLTSIFLQPLNEVHLHSPFQWDYHNLNKGNITYIYVLSTVAICLLIIACINFMNLSTAQSGRRSKEIGVRKVHGAHRRDLICQFLGESISISFISLLLAFLLVGLFLPAFNQVSGRQIPMGKLYDVRILLGMISVTIFAGFLAGSYPALYLSSMRTIKILKSALTSTKRGLSLRKVLVVVQFAIAIALMIGTVVIASQLHFMQTKDMGLDIKNTLMFAGLRRINDVEMFKNELRQNPHVLSVTQSLGPVAGFNSSSEVDWDGKKPEENIILHHCPVDYEYLNSFRIEISEGRFFSRQITTDKSNYVLNETAVKAMGIDSPVGKRFSYNGAEGIIIGVLKDFHTMIPRDPIQPLVFQISSNAWMMYVKIDENHISTTVDHIKYVWNKHVPDHPFYYDFVDDELNEFYEKERQLRQIFIYISCLAVFVACLGLVGLSSFLAEQKTKEIGIRKVLGGTVSSVVILLSREFIKWVLVANIISWPIAYLIMNRWLQSYAFRMNLGPGTFVITGGTALFIAMLTVSYQAIKAATSNPVDALRYE